ncbi:MAG TPA: hypothetical protein VGG35_12990 [Streptosporangiaceae bacterium]
MTAAGLDSSPRKVSAAGGSAPAAMRLTRLYAASRRIPVALGLLAAVGALLAVALDQHWAIAGGPAAQRVIPLSAEACAAAVIAVSCHGPFGEAERATGRWLPWLQLAAAVALTAAAFGVLAAAGPAGLLPGGAWAVLRNVAGMSGLGLLCASGLGGPFGWVGPAAYLVISEAGLAAGWSTPWLWAGRPPHDLGGAVCAGVACAAGLAAITLTGARGPSRSAGPG